MNIEIANRLVQMRKEKGLSQEDLADKLGISRQSVSKWERAEASPDTDNLICLAQIYGISLDDLLKTDQSANEIASEEKEKVEEKKDKDINIHISQSGIQFTSNGKTEQKNWSLTPAEKEYCEQTLNLKKKKIFKRFFDSIVWGLGIVGYIVAAALTDMWHPLWLVLFLPIFITSIDDSIIEKNFSGGYYVVAVTQAYLSIGFALNLWHPYWFLFITIPFFYGLTELLNYLFKCGKYDPDHKLRKKYLLDFDRIHKKDDDDDDDDDDE